MGIFIFDIYNNPNVGIFAKVNENFTFLPSGYPKPKSTKLASLLNTNIIFASIGSTRLLGPLIVTNSYGILVSKFTTDEELANLRSKTSMRVERLMSDYSSVGNLICANDYGAIVSTILGESEINQIHEVLRVKTVRMRIWDLHQVGAAIVASNNGALIHPKASDQEIKLVSETLSVDCEAGTVNGGVPFVSSGILVNTKGAIVGTQISGPELFIIGKTFKL
ncbi:MAG: translation initiation factor IF-6 [Nitrososphaerota archaeon]